ncbi:glycosyltransferase family 2 protein, partial [Klebsiella pneumoniae]
IINQSYNNLEIILCNDGSQDNTYHILKKFSQTDSRIKLINNKHNLGLISSLNLMISISSGDYIARMDADDISIPNRIEKQVENILFHDADGVGSCYVTFGGKKKYIYLPTNSEDIQYCSAFYNPFCHPSMLLRQSVLKENKYSHLYPHVEDYELWSRLIKNKYKLINVNDILLNYRIHSTQISATKWKEQLPLLSIIKGENFKNFVCNNDNIYTQFLHLWSISISDTPEFIKQYRILAQSEKYKKNKRYIIPSIIYFLSLNKFNLIDLIKILACFPYSLKFKLLLLYIKNINKRKHINE